MNPHSHPVRNIDTGATYCSVTEAAQATNVSLNALCNALKRGHRCGGYRWKYLKGMQKMLMCLETGHTYPSIQSAAENLYIGRNTIGRAIKHNRPAFGYTFRWVDPLDPSCEAMR
jgi:hypothetical protein